MKVKQCLSAEKNLLIRKNTCRLLLLGILLATFLWLYRSFYTERAWTSLTLEGLQEIQISSTEYPYFLYHMHDLQSPIFTNKKLLYKTTLSLIDKPPHDYYNFAFLYEDQQKILFQYGHDLKCL